MEFLMVVTVKFTNSLHLIAKYPMVAFCTFCCILAAAITVSQTRVNSIDHREDYARVAYFRNIYAASTQNESTCSFKATKRGRAQKVVSYAYFYNWMSTREYFAGIERNVLMVKKDYPGWLMRVYHDSADLTTRQLLLDLERKYGDVLDFCYVGSLPGYGNFLGRQHVWRLLTLGDPLVDVTMFRDLDSVPLEREREAVAEWLKSNFSMHVMRDHPDHSKIAVLGAFWGAKLNNGKREQWRRIINEVMEFVQSKPVQHNAANNLMQAPLEETVWRAAVSEKDFVMQHDSYSCTSKTFAAAGGMRPFPSCRETKTSKEPNFVGARFNFDGFVAATCPKECRFVPSCMSC